MCASVVLFSTMKERVSAFVILAVIMLQVVQVDGFSYALPLRTPRARALAQGHAPTRSCAPVHRTRLLMLKPEDMSVCVVEVHGDDVVIKATVFSDGMERSWTFRRAYDEFDDFQAKMNKLFAFSMPPLPPRSYFTSPNVVEDYFDQIFENHRTLSSRPLIDFMEMPIDVHAEPVVRKTIIDVTPEATTARADKDLTPQAASAGAVVGVILGGPVGALLGGAAAAWASKQDGAVGEVARTAGKAADVAVKKAKTLDKKYSITERATKNIKTGLKKVRDALEKLDLDEDR